VVQAGRGNNKTLTATDPNFIETYYKSSRLHHLSMWRSQFEEELNGYLEEIASREGQQDRIAAQLVQQLLDLHQKETLRVSEGRGTGDHGEEDGDAGERDALLDMRHEETEANDADIVAGRVEGVRFIMHADMVRTQNITHTHTHTHTHTFIGLFFCLGCHCK